MDHPRILIVDQDPVFRNRLFIALRYDYHVSVACCGKEGLTKALMHPPQLIILSQWPTPTFLLEIGSFASNSKLSKIPIMIVSEDARRESIAAAIKCGAADYNLKQGFNDRDFVSRVQKVLKLSRDAAAREQSRQVPSIRSAESASVIGTCEQAETSELRMIVDSWE